MRGTSNGPSAAAAGGGSGQPGSSSAGNFGNQRAMPVPGVGAPRPQAGGYAGWGGSAGAGLGSRRPPGMSVAQWEAHLEAEVRQRAVLLARCVDGCQ
jgi:hypothetical protein